MEQKSYSLVRLSGFRFQVSLKLLKIHQLNQSRVKEDIQELESF